ncbi:MAG TPA: diaminopimelate epimerase [Acidimicrobiia bacterium]|nr:diaminopimelate epimerase [Acidimicrobiia bacterium]
MSRYQFTKMQGLGNDFIVLEGPDKPDSSEVVGLCDRHFGVGADGVLVVSPGPPVVMDYWNADGSPAEMCGNGLRCVARYARDRGWTDAAEFEVDTPIGLRKVRVGGGAIEVEIGPVLIEGQETIDGEVYHLVDTGNPHAVRVVDDPERIDLATLGPQVAREAGFDAGCNVEMITIADGRVTMRVWERGIGETLACGTGMVAAAAVALDGKDGSIEVATPGGVGHVEVDGQSAWLTGPAEYVFEGVVDQG